MKKIITNVGFSVIVAIGVYNLMLTIRCALITHRTDTIGVVKAIRAIYSKTLTRAPRLQIEQKVNAEYGFFKRQTDRLFKRQTDHQECS